MLWKKLYKEPSEEFCNDNEVDMFQYHFFDSSLAEQQTYA